MLNQKTNLKPKLLLHSCCAPCSTTCIERLCENYAITVYYYNPNIDSVQEYDKRALEQQVYLKNNYKDVDVVIEKYDKNQFLNAISGCEGLGEGSQRCYLCYQLRIAQTIKYASENNFDCACTTLSVSPYKNSKWINQIGETICKFSNVKWVESNFKKQDGYKRSVELSNLNDMYRQNYCGCEFSKLERERALLNKKTNN